MLRLIAIATVALLSITTQAQAIPAELERIEKQHAEYRELLRKGFAEQKEHAKVFRQDMDIVSQSFRADQDAAEGRIRRVGEIFAKYDAKKKKLRHTSAALTGLFSRVRMLESGEFSIRTNSRAKWANSNLIWSSETVPSVLAGHPEWLANDNPKDIAIALRKLDTLLTETVIFYHQYVRPILMKNVKTKNLKGKDRTLSNLACYTGDPGRISRYIESLTLNFPELMNAKFVIATLEMESELQVFHDLHYAYITEAENEAGRKKRDENKKHFQKGKDFDYEKMAGIR